MSDFVEAAIDAIYSALTVNDETAEDIGGTTFTTKLREINTEKGDSLLDPLSFVVSNDSYPGSPHIFKGRRFVNDVFPALVIWQEDSPQDVSHETTGSIDPKHNITIWCLAVADDQETLQKMLWRYMRAVTEVVLTDWTLNNEVDKCDLVGFTYENPWLADSEQLQFFGANGVQFKIHKEVEL